MLNSKDLLTEMGLCPNKALGQNFLVDASALSRIAEIADCHGMPVLEIGPGLGALTNELVQDASRLLAVEIDRRMADALMLQFQTQPNLKIVCRDFLKYSDEEIAAELGSSQIVVAANLPYYITSPICARLLESQLPICRMVLMMQDEAAERFTAKPKAKNYGPLSILAQYLYDVSVVSKLSPASYYPAPDVNSTVLLFERNTNIMPKAMPKILRSAFAMRRKTLLNNMLGIMPKQTSLSAIECAGLEPTVRAEALNADDFVRLAMAVEHIAD